MANINTGRKYPYYDAGLGRVVNSERHRREIMKGRGLIEEGSMESEKRRTERLAEEINDARKKQGLQSKTVQELVGTTRRVPTKLFFFTK